MEIKTYGDLLKKVKKFCDISVDTKCENPSEELL